jgi:Zn finger protein HypA/HybF involved in hydrogenase expression
METTHEHTACSDCGTTDNLTIDCGDYALCDQCGSDHLEMMREPN